MIKITQNFYQVETKMAIHRWFTAVCLMTVLWLGTIGQVNAQEVGYDYVTATTTNAWSATQTFNGGTAQEVTISTNTSGSIKTATVCNTSSITHYELGGTSVFLEINLGATSSTSTLTVQFTGSSNSTTANACKAGVVYSNKFPFSLAAGDVIGAQDSAFLPASNGTWTPLTLTVPAGTKSLRIYRRIYYNPTTNAAQTGSSSGFTQYGLGTTVRVAAVKVTVTPSVPTITLTSAVGTDAQTVPANAAITDIAYTLGGTATAAGTNIAWDTTPGGITFNKSANPVTISGTPTVQGTYNYTITTDGTPAAIATGSIAVTAPDVTPPTLQSSTPANATSDVALSGTIALAFDEIVTLADANKITLTGGAGSLTTTGVADGTTLTIPYAGLAGATTYTLTIDSGAIEDMSSNAYAGTTLTFTTLVPAPVITLTSAVATTNQSIKSGQTIAPITYTFANANATTPYTLTGVLPTGVTANYAASVLTISGTATATTFPTTSDYTITAVPLAGYTGSDVEASGSIVVRDPNAKNVAFLYSGTLPAGANKLYDMLNNNYTVTAIQTTGTGNATDFDAAYTGHDLIVLHESVTSGNLAAQKLGTKIGTVPVLNTKSHMYGKTNWPAGAGANGAAGDTFINVNSDFQAHPIFAGVTMTAGQVIMANTNGIIRYATGVTATSNIASNKSGTATNVSVLEVNNQTAADAYKYILIALAAANEDLTDNGLLVFKNTCDYLMSSNVYFAPTIWTGTALGGSWSNNVPTSAVEAIVDGVFDTSVSTGFGFTAKKLTVNSGATLTVASGTNITIQNEVINNAAATALVVENNANLIQVNSVANTGEITVRRNSNSLFRLDYTLWSSPVNGTQTLYDFSPMTSTNRFNVYNPVTNAYEVILNGAYFGTGKGYLIRMPNSDATPGYNTGTTAITYNGVFTGTPNNGTVTLTSLDGITANAFNGIGNPYPSTIDADLFLGGNATTGTLYFFRKTNLVVNSNSSYATYTTLGGTQASNVAPNDAIPNGVIQVGQGFVVEPTTTTISFTNGMRTANNANQFFKTKKVVDKNRIWLNLTNTTGAFSQALVGYMTGATEGVDTGIDGKSINDGKVALTSNIDNVDYTIQGRSLPFDPADVVPLNFKTDVAGDYTIAIDHADGLFAAGQDVYLVDSVTGTETDLKAGAYTFTAPVGTANARFSLKYQKTLGIDTSSFNENSVTVYKNKGVLSVNSGNITIANVKVYDVQGKLLAELKDVKSTSATISNLKSTQQVLVVKVTAQDGTVVTKKVIN